MWPLDKHGAKRSLGNQTPRSLSIAREWAKHNLNSDYAFIPGNIC
jgi:hypothetical protein